MHRLFVGLRPPPAIRARLAATMEGVPGARWQDDAQLHVTLRFIGEVEPRTADDVASALDAIHAPPLELTITGVGRFEKRGRTHALWAGISPRTPLAALHRKIDAALMRLGLPPEGRAYLPHVTLARMNVPDVAVERFLAEHAALTSPRFTLDHMLLFESRLGREGARYEAVARYPLDAPPLSRA